MSEHTEKIEKKGNSLTEKFQSELLSVKTGRASASLLSHVTVEAYGAETSLKDVANVSAPEARLLVIQPYDKTVLGEIEKGILKANLGITPSNDGSVIRMTIPPMTADSRKQAVKDLKAMAERFKVQVRNLRRDAMSKIKQDKELSEDAQSRENKECDKLISKLIEKIEALASEKEKSLSEV